MKKFLIAAVAASMLSVPVVAAPAMAAPAPQDRGDWHDRDHGPDRGRDHGPDRGPNRGPDRGRDWRPNGPGDRGGWDHRGWARGQRFDYRYAPNYGVIDYRHYRGLRRPPRGYHWVRSGDDALLVGITTGVIASVIAGGIR